MRGGIGSSCGRCRGITAARGGFRCGDRDDLHLDVSVRYGEFEDRPYEHRFYNERTDAYDERTSFARSRPVEVSLVLEGAYLTPLGAGLSSGGEGSGRCAFRAQVRGAADATVEGGAG